MDGVPPATSLHHWAARVRDEDPTGAGRFDSGGKKPRRVHEVAVESENENRESSLHDGTFLTKTKTKKKKTMMTKKKKEEEEEEEETCVRERGGERGA